MFEIRLTLVYDVDGVPRPAIRYQNLRVRGDGATSPASFSRVQFRQAAHNIRDWLDAVRAVGAPTPPPVVEPSTYKLEVMRATLPNTFDLEIGNLEYKATYDGSLVTVQTYTQFNLPWSDFVWVQKQVQQFVDNLMGAP